MKKILLAYAVLLISIALLALVKYNVNLSSVIPFAKKNTATVAINNHNFDLILAKSDKEKQKGLSGTKSLEKNKGMLFVFEKADNYSFWMKDMLFPIDIIYINDNKVVDLIKNAPIVKDGKNLIIYKPSEKAKYILEINAGLLEEYGIKKGTKVEFNNL